MPYSFIFSNFLFNPYTKSGRDRDIKFCMWIEVHTEFCRLYLQLDDGNTSDVTAKTQIEETGRHKQLKIFT